MPLATSQKKRKGQRGKGESNPRGSKSIKRVRLTSSEEPLEEEPDGISFEDIYCCK